MKIRLKVKLGINMFKNWIKRIKMIFLKGQYDVKRNIGKWISYTIMVMCVLLFILALFSNVAHRMPILSYFATEMRLPFLLELNGEVSISCENEEVIVPVEVNIGGYSIHTKSGELFDVRFSSENRDNIPVVIKFIYNNEEYVKLEYISYNNEYSIMCEYE